MCREAGVTRRSGRPRPAVWRRREPTVELTPHAMHNRHTQCYHHCSQGVINIHALVFNLNSMPCFLRIFWKLVAISVSIPGVMRSRNSTTVTCGSVEEGMRPSVLPTPAPFNYCISHLGAEPPDGGNLEPTAPTQTTTM